MLLHEFRHINANHGLFGIKQEVCQRLAQLGLTHPGRPEEQERTVGAIRIRQTSPGTAHRIGHGFHRLILTNDPIMERFLHAHQLVALTLQHLGYRNPGPLGDDFSNFLIRDPVAQQLHFHHFRLAGHIQLPLQLRNLAVLQFGHLAEIPGTAGVLQVNPGLLQLTLDLL